MSDPVEMKAKINTDLKYYGRAVEELSKGNEGQILRAIKFIKEHNLYALGAKLFSSNKKVLNEINSAFGNYSTRGFDLKLLKVIMFSQEKIISSLRYSMSKLRTISQP